METTAPTVHVVDDDSAVRESLRWLLESVDKNVALYDSAETFLTGFVPGSAGCIISDMRMPDSSGLQLLLEMKKRGYRTPTIILTAHGDVATAVRSMKAGAFDFLEKPVNDQELLDLVDAAICEDREQRRAAEALLITLEKFDALSNRERQTMRLVGDGKSNKEIARVLDISPKTVEAHRANVMKKMAAGSVAEIVRLATVCFPPDEKK